MDFMSLLMKSGMQVIKLINLIIIIVVSRN